MISESTRREIAALWETTSKLDDEGALTKAQWVEHLRAEVKLLGEEPELEAIVQLGFSRQFITTIEEVDALLAE